MNASSSCRVIFVIPAYNEEHNIGCLLRGLAGLERGRLDFSVIVVNDGSWDRTREVATGCGVGLPIEVIDHPTNLGVGAAFRTGFTAALMKARPADIIVSMEADNTSDLSILHQMLKQIETGSDVSLASCYAPKGGVLGTTPSRVLFSKAANLIIERLYGVSEVHTYSSFYRAYRASALFLGFETYGDAFISEPGFVCVVEVLVKLHRLGLKLTEIPMILDGSRRAGTSKMRVTHTVLGYLTFILHDATRHLRWWLQPSHNPPDRGEIPKVSIR
ncbi:MAG TPA: glycosyltransferase family 2 protein [Chloroflexota bacterium]|nr:glycosyltransferase family 2 protein [Chloroflexota bacterium]